MIHLLTLLSQECNALLLFGMHRWELELGVEDNLTTTIILSRWLVSTEKYSYLFLLTSSMICPWPCQLKRSQSLSFSFSVNNLMRNTYEASGIIIDVLPIVMFHSGMCHVCVFTAKWNWESFKGKDKHVPCFVLYRMMEIRNGGTKWTLYWIWSQMIWINLSLAVWP